MGIFTPFQKTLLRLSTSHYQAFLKGIITPFEKAFLRLYMRKWRNNLTSCYNTFFALLRLLERRYKAFQLIFFSMQFDTKRLS